MSPARSNSDTINRRDRDHPASHALGLGFMPMSMRSTSTLNLNGRPTDADAGFIDPEDSRRRNSSEANGMASATGFEVVAPNGVFGRGDSSNRRLRRSRVRASSSSHPNRNSDIANHHLHRHDSTNGWRWVSKSNLVLIALLVIVAGFAFINNEKKNAIIHDLENKNSSLKDQYLLVSSKLSQLGSEQAPKPKKMKGSEKKGKANKDDCCACQLTSSVRMFLSNVPSTLSCE